MLRGSFSALQRAEIAEICESENVWQSKRPCFSALQRAEIAESGLGFGCRASLLVSVLFNEPKLLKLDLSDNLKRAADCFSALQRAEIAEI